MYYDFENIKDKNYIVKLQERGYGEFMFNKKQILKRIGRNCQKLRQQIGYTQSEMSKKLNEIFDINTTYKLFSHFENGESDSLIIFLCYLEMSSRHGLHEMLNGVNLDNYWYREDEPT